jgi:biopolymer transport protein ExbD
MAHDYEEAQPPKPTKATPFINVTPLIDVLLV